MKINDTLIREYVVLSEHSAKNIGSGDLEVLSTPMLVAFMEETAKILINQYLDKNYGTVGSNININHLRPTKIGKKINIEVRIVEIIKNKVINFEIYAYENNVEIANAKHTRVVIENEKFLSRIN
ncbi:thioesterase family protein [Gemella sp. GH3]|uniref:thioesterase family protein n=1 Tax=unclassified Gemella TaxID=2624949 RepID=UPI0015D04E8F|nr:MULTISPECIES: thioesterase family protein [unclassified Gemella]MBF0714401.1 thioesterase family protein [Gemella sp. GH3.1]NYS51353.1 thioesterase family protein [Gemella sp. GH3]